MMTLSEFIDEEMKDPEFKKEWDLLDAEFAEMQRKIDSQVETEIRQPKLPPLKQGGILVGNIA